MFRQPKYRLTIYTSEEKTKVMMVRKYARLAELQKDLGNPSLNTIHLYLRGKRTGKTGRAHRYFPIFRYCALEHINKTHPVGPYVLPISPILPVSLTLQVRQPQSINQTAVVAM